MTIEITHGVEGRRRTVTVPLSNSKRKVTLYSDDFELLTHRGLGLPWRLEAGTVWVRNSDPIHRKLSIARLIADAGQRQNVKYIDLNPLNLLRSNLVLCPGGAKFRTWECVKPSLRRPHYEIKHIRDHILDAEI